MEIFEIHLTKEKPKSEYLYFSAGASTIEIVGILSAVHLISLVFKTSIGQLVKRAIHPNNLNTKITIPEWAGYMYLELGNNDIDKLSFKINIF